LHDYNLRGWTAGFSPGRNAIHHTRNVRALPLFQQPRRLRHSQRLGHQWLYVAVDPRTIIWDSAALPHPHLGVRLLSFTGLSVQPIAGPYDSYLHFFIPGWCATIIRTNDTSPAIASEYRSAAKSGE